MEDVTEHVKSEKKEECVKIDIKENESYNSPVTENVKNEKKEECVEIDNEKKESDNSNEKEKETEKEKDTEKDPKTVWNELEGRYWNYIFVLLQI